MTTIASTADKIPVAFKAFKTWTGSKRIYNHYNV